MKTKKTKNEGKVSKLDELMQKEMTRKQFLKTVGIGVLSIFGISAILGLFAEHDTSVNRGPSAYGERTYGH